MQSLKDLEHSIMVTLSYHIVPTMLITAFWNNVVWVFIMGLSIFLPWTLGNALFLECCSSLPLRNLSIAESVLITLMDAGKWKKVKNAENGRHITNMYNYYFFFGLSLWLHMQSCSMFHISMLHILLSVPQMSQTSHLKIKTRYSSILSNHQPDGSQMLSFCHVLEHSHMFPYSHIYINCNECKCVKLKPRNITHETNTQTCFMHCYCHSDKTTKVFCG